MVYEVTESYNRRPWLPMLWAWCKWAAIMHQKEEEEQDELE